MPLYLPPFFASISTFRDSVERLIKREQDGYSSCKDDVCAIFKPLAFSDIWELNMRTRDLGDVRVIKVRVANSGQKLSSADGFRLIIACHKRYQMVGLLNIYPKRGKHACLDQSKEDYKMQLKRFSGDFKSAKLRYYDIGNHLGIFPLSLPHEFSAYVLDKNEKILRNCYDRIHLHMVTDTWQLQVRQLEESDRVETTKHWTEFKQQFAGK